MNNIWILPAVYLLPFYLCQRAGCVCMIMINILAYKHHTNILKIQLSNLSLWWPFITDNTVHKQHQPRAPLFLLECNNHQRAISLHRVWSESKHALKGWIEFHARLGMLQMHGARDKSVIIINMPLGAEIFNSMNSGRPIVLFWILHLGLWPVPNNQLKRCSRLIQAAAYIKQCC